MKRLLIFLVWPPSLLLTLGVSLFFYGQRAQFLNQQALLSQKIKENIVNNQTYQLYTSIPQVLGLSTLIQAKNDPTFKIISQYLKTHRSPMAKSASSLIQVCREKEIDPLLLIAIAQCETNLGKKSPENCFNPFGLGIYSKKKICFKNWQESYRSMANTLRKNYFNQGLTTPEQIMSKYCPTSIKKSDGHWAKCVNHFLVSLKKMQ